MRKHFAFVLALICLAGCQSQENSTPEPKTGESGYTINYPIPVAATVGMVADLVKNVGQEYVDVHQIMGSGVDPHMHKASRDDVVTIMNSDIVFYSGLMLEGKMTDTLIKVSRNKPVFAVTELIDEKTLLEPEDFHGHYDPHVWMDVSAWAQCVDAVKDALIKYDPKHADVYENNAKAYKQQLEQLHEYGQKTLKTIPEDSRTLITSHDAFNYFGRAYGLDVQGVQGISTESEAGLKRINELVDLLVKKKIKAVFVESSVSKKNITALIEGARAQGHQIVIGGELFSDAMGEPGTYEGTYIGMLDHNMTTVARALGGTAPEKGMQDKLTH
ncbi:metal ABC transporter solute-binding protein, Zn/Mn family [Gimesia panareensis]|uniref:Periplasmic zinc-binding protein TroA n=1 Tax=Gimesia panareensis TaxID=2527978 RepID=A0A517Q0V5_9PLAN|nr:zinc ABC transporter substrate-binding protein [Gimesia panareensis]QDT25255.1 Periplasmic zinc-binding protein TroA precursor [Gimesia panareensis]QDU48213.1 Periplasmic zinc-binding protein TroA precursor [Gimesia panareensis]